MTEIMQAAGPTPLDQAGRAGTGGSSGDPDLPIAMLCDRQVWAFPSLWRTAYLPFGAVLAVARLLAIPVFSLTALLLPARGKPRLFRMLLAVMGLRITYNLNRQEIGAHVEGCVVAANHISLLDNFLVSSLPYTTIMVGDPVRGANPLSVAIGYLAFHCAGGTFWTVRDRRQLVRRLATWKGSPRGTALYVTPETTINNGQGLFRFQPEFLARGMPVVPLALSLKTPFGLNPHPLHASGSATVLRLLMMPSLRYDLTYLPRQTRQPDQSPEAFARQVQETVANHLGIPATAWSRDDKHAFRRATRARPTGQAEP